MLRAPLAPRTNLVGQFVTEYKIARIVGHTETATTEIVYRKQIRPVVLGGAGVPGESLFGLVAVASAVSDALGVAGRSEGHKAHRIRNSGCSGPDRFRLDQSVSSLLHGRTPYGVD